MSKFFIDRPIFAWVIALVIMLVGALSILKLPIKQYPSIAPPAIAISVTYPGASAQTVQDTVVQVIEQQLNGIDNLRYVSSESNSDGSMTITAPIKALTALSRSASGISTAWFFALLNTSLCGGLSLLALTPACVLADTTDNLMNRSTLTGPSPRNWP